MDTIIKQAVKEELKRQNLTSSTSSGSSDNPSNSSIRKSQTATRLSGLLDRIRNSSPSSSASSNDESDDGFLFVPSTSNSRCTNAESKLVCSKCACTYTKGEECIRCQQDKEYQETLVADTNKTSEMGVTNNDNIDTVEDDHLTVEESSIEENHLTVEEMRQRRVAALTARSSADITGILDDSNLQDIPDLDNTAVMSDNNGPGAVSNRSPPLLKTKHLRVHRSCLKTELISHFKDESILMHDITFEVINQRGEMEKGVGIGVARDIYSSFWEEFSISMTVGERERVPFVRHDHFVDEWRSVGRILVKGYTSVGYFPFFLSKVFICYCLFPEEVHDDMFYLDAFKRYLSPSEEEMINGILKKGDIPEDRDELDDFLDRFNCRTYVTKENIVKIFVELSKQELVQKPHVMAAAWQPILQSHLKVFCEFQSVPNVQGFYERIKPTTRKVLDSIECCPNTSGERDALKFLQRFIRGLEMPKLAQFLRFTTAMDIMGKSKVQVTFIKSEGLASRPIAHTCGPVLELPSTYTNFVELREEFTNILNKDKWEIDIA